MTTHVTSPQTFAQKALARAAGLDFVAVGQVIDARPDIVLSHDNMRMPEQGDIYSVNEAYIDEFPEVYQRYIAGLRRGEFGRRYKSRYIGSMVADFHRTLLKGGVFLYPPTQAQSEGKLRLLYEANPMAFITEQAGGRALDGSRRVLDIEPTSLHQRTPLILGGKAEMDAFERLL